jgi:Mg2+ and Co2+ transporter CorA
MDTEIVSWTGASVFGMNIEHGLEKSPYAFPIVVSILVGASVRDLPLLYYTLL